VIGKAGTVDDCKLALTGLVVVDKKASPSSEALHLGPTINRSCWRQRCAVERRRIIIGGVLVAPHLDAAKGI
jgi:hypothetical protein